jgi:AraC family ethanolamine operon transcriptional activator
VSPPDSPHRRHPLDPVPLKTFTDFDAWGDAISGASLSLACDAVETPRWTIGVASLGEVVLQVAFEGGGNVCYGGNTHEGLTLFVPLSRAAEHVVNGEPLDDESLLVIPTGADFRIRVRRRAHAWCSIALPPAASAAWQGPSVSGRVAAPAGAVPRLRRLVDELAVTLLGRPADTAAHADAGKQLMTAAIACLPPAAQSPAPRGRPRLDRRAIVKQAMETLETAVTVPTAADLAEAIGVNGRTLQRTFQESFGMPPKQYLLLRTLHAVRRSLRAAAWPDTTVADVLVRHGIWEFGRFASRYRRHFGELPSETMRREPS